MDTSARGLKSLYFSEGLLEGAETITFFVLLCLFPGSYGPLAWISGTLCYTTGILRIATRGIFRSKSEPRLAQPAIDRIEG